MGQAMAAFESFLFLLRLLDLDNIDLNEGRLIFKLKTLRLKGMSVASVASGPYGEKLGGHFF